MKSSRLLLLGVAAVVVLTSHGTGSCRGIVRVVVADSGTRTVTLSGGPYWQWTLGPYTE